MVDCPISKPHFHIYELEKVSDGLNTPTNYANNLRMYGREGEGLGEGEEEREEERNQ